MSAKLKVLRLQAGLTLEDVAGRSGLTRSYLSKVERGLAMPSIAAALKIAEVLEVSVEALFGSDSSSDPVAIVRSRGAPRDGVVQLVAGDSPSRKLVAFVLHPAELGQSGNPTSHHEGEELVYVLAGSVELRLADRKEVLEAGDCAHFESTIPHKISSLDGPEAQVLIVISPVAPKRGAAAKSRTVRAPRGTAARRASPVTRRVR